MLKRAIPVGAVAAVALVLVITLFNPFASVGGLSIGPVNVSGTRIVMESPRMTGYQDGNRPYEVTATQASQDVRTPHLVDLVDLRARVTADAEGNVVRVEAATGLFDTQAELLTLQRDVRVTSTLGYTANLDSATVDFVAGTVVSEEKVRVGIGTGVIEADSLTLIEGGEIITFVGGVTSTFLLGEGRSEP